MHEIYICSSYTKRRSTLLEKRFPGQANFIIPNGQAFHMHVKDCGNIIFIGGLWTRLRKSFLQVASSFSQALDSPACENIPSEQKKIACHHPLPATALPAPAESRVRVLGERGRVKQRCAAAGATVGFGREERKLRAAATVYGLK